MTLPTGLTLRDKLKLLRKMEGLSQVELCEMTGISQSTLAGFEAGRRDTMNSDTLLKIVNHPRLLPYAMWLMIDDLTEDQAEESLAYLRTLNKRD